MKNEQTRAGANPADTAKPQTAPLSAPAVSRAISLAALHLEDNLVSTARLLQACTEMAGDDGPQGLMAIRTAARLLRAQSDAASMLARVARGESRHRTIVEYADAPPKEAPEKSNTRLNSKNLAGGPPRAAGKRAGRRNDKRSK